MRRAFEPQLRLDCDPVVTVQLNLNCRDEIIPILRALQHIYSRPDLRSEILELVGKDVNRSSRSDRGREGLSYWCVLVLAAVRIGCNLDYDKLHDLAENHRKLRQIMGIGDWDDEPVFSARQIEENVIKLRPETLEKVNQLIVSAGHQLDPDAVKQMRTDSFVVETNIHYPTESSLILDGLRKILEIAPLVAVFAGVVGWRQHKHLWKKAQQYGRNISRLSRQKKKQGFEERLKKAYQRLFGLAEKITSRAEELLVRCDESDLRDSMVLGKCAELKDFLQATKQVCGTAYSRVVLGETVPNSKKLFSIFERHTQLYKRGKDKTPLQFGRLVLVTEDSAGFIAHYHILPRDKNDGDVVVEQTRILQERMNQQVEAISFDRGFHSPENQEELAKIVPHVCLPKPGAKQSKEQENEATDTFRRLRRRHPGIESGIGALQSGNGLKRCRDRSEKGFNCYVGLGVLGRNLHVLGKHLLAREAPRCEAATSFRQRAAA